MKTLKTIICLTLLFAYMVVKAQITTNENPISFTQSTKRSTTKIIEITPPNMQKVYAEDKAKGSDILNRIAVAIPVHLSIKKDGEWEQLPNGNKLWKLTLSVKNALFLDVSFNEFWLPKGGKFFVYSRKTRQVIGAVTDEFLRGTKQQPADFATAMIRGNEITLEYYQPVDCEEFPVINVSNLYYGYKSISVLDKSSGTGFGTSNPCHININCEEGNNWQDEKRAIARVLIISSEGSFWGSGALLNNTTNNLEPLFLTAHHNLKGIFDAINNPMMSQAIFYWDYEHLDCNNSSEEPLYKTTLGADVIANKEYTDFALLKLRQDPRDLTNFIPYYLGWDKSGNTGTGSIGIHHPKGDVKKISISSGSATNEWHGLNWPTGTHSNPNTHWKVTFTKGFMEGGSSGSPLLNNERKVIGQLHGGLNSSTCNNDTEYYGKFNLSWTGNGATDNRRKLQPWLDPLGTNQNTIEGRYPFVISGSNTICNQETYTIENLPLGATVHWSVNTSYLQVSASGVVSKINDQAEGGAVITAHITTASGDSISISKNVQYISKYINGYFKINYTQRDFFTSTLPMTGRYAETGISGGERINIQLTKPNVLPSSCQFNWQFLQKPSCITGHYVSSGYNMVIDTSQPTNTEVIQIKVSVDCAPEVYAILTIYVNSFGPYTYRISEGVLTIKNDDNAYLKGSNVQNIKREKREIKQVQLYNLQARKVVDFSTSKFQRNFSVEIPISHLPSGFYVLRVYDGKQWYKKKIWLKEIF